MKPWLRWMVIVACTILFTTIIAILVFITYIGNYVRSLNIQD